jgi:hypothetical protein
LPPGRAVAPKTPPCAFDIQRAVELESRAAANIRTLSAQVASDFLRTVGAVGRTGRNIPTISDNAYWFAKLYEIVTIQEIAESRNYRQPAFVLHFIPVFFDLYYQALQMAETMHRKARRRSLNGSTHTGCLVPVASA